VVALRAVHAFARAAQPAEDVATSDHDADLHTGRVHTGQLRRGGLEGRRVDPEAAFAPAQCLAAELDDDTFVAERWFLFVGHGLPRTPRPRRLQRPSRWRDTRRGGGRSRPGPSSPSFEAARLA